MNVYEYSARAPPDADFENDGYKDYPGHDCMLTKGGELQDPASCIPELREYAEDLPPTAATWKPRQVADTASGVLRPTHLAFVGAWPVPEHFTQASSQKYVNPNYVHAKEYGGISVECACGKRIDSYRENEHGEGCDASDRKAARARLVGERIDEIEMLALHGWSAEEIGVRLGMSQSGVKKTTRNYGTPMSELYEEYQRLSGETYAHLVENTDTLGTEVAEVYGVHPKSLIERAKRFADYEPMDQRSDEKFARAARVRWGKASAAGGD